VTRAPLCRQYPQLEGRQDLIANAFNQHVAKLMEKHKNRAVDARSETHLKVAALVLATQRTLLPFLRSDQVSCCTHHPSSPQRAASLSTPPPPGAALPSSPPSSTAYSRTDRRCFQYRH
jgi:hypothetical protein